MNAIKKAKEIIAKGEKATPGPWHREDDWSHEVLSANGYLVASTPTVNHPKIPDGGKNATYIAAANPADLLPLLRLLVECEEGVKGIADLPLGDHRAKTMASALLDKLRSES